VTDILGKRTGRSSRSVTFNLEIPQDHARYITLGQQVEVTFNSQPGSVYTGRVEAMQPGAAKPVQPGVLVPPPLQVRISLDDHQMAEQLPAGSTGLAAVFGDDAKANMNRRVVLRQTAVLSYAA
jgi:multidrug resistance efflux pump